MANNTLTDRLESLDEDTRGLVIELAASIATHEAVHDVVIPNSVANIGTGKTLMQQLSSMASSTVVTTSESVLPDTEVKSDQALNSQTTGVPTTQQEVTSKSQLNLYKHPRAPVEMRNFLSLVMPEGRLSDTAFELRAKSASLLAYTLITIYKGLPKRANQRFDTADLLTRHVGLYAEPVGYTEIDTTRPHIGASKVSSAIERVAKDIPVSVLENALYLAQDQDEEAIIQLIESHLDQVKKDYAGIEAEDIPEGYTRRILKDNTGKKHSVLWNDDSLDIVVDGVRYEAKRVSNLYRDRLAILKCLIRHKSQSFSSSKLHEKGVGKGGKQTDSGVRQAIKYALKELEQICVNVAGKQVSILGYASPRTYQLSEQLGGPVVDSKKFKNRSRSKSGDDIKAKSQEIGMPSANRLVADGVAINGRIYPLLDPGEKHWLRPILDAPRILELSEISAVVHGVNEPNELQIEDTEEALYELARRGILVIRQIGDGEAQYLINEDIEQTLETLTELELSSDDVIYLRDWDIDILRVLMSTSRALSVAQVARRLNPEQMLSQEDYDDLALTIKKYLYPHGVVLREELQDGVRTNRFYMPDDIKNILSENGITI